MIVLPDVLNGEELRLIREFLDEAEFEDGKLTAPDTTAKNNEQASRGKDPKGISTLDAVVAEALSRHELFRAYAWPRRLSAALYARYDPGMHYGAHVDAPLMGATPQMRSDVSITIFLNEPTDYEGGELALDLGGGAVQQVKLPAGHAVVYSTTMVHQVRPVTRGRRLVAVLWAQSHARDPRVRESLFDLRAALESLRAKTSDAIEVRLLEKTINNLERYFAEA